MKLQILYSFGMLVVIEFLGRMDAWGAVQVGVQTPCLAGLFVRGRDRANSADVLLYPFDIFMGLLVVYDRVGHEVSEDSSWRDGSLPWHGQASCPNRPQGRFARISSVLLGDGYRWYPFPRHSNRSLLRVM